MMVPCKDCEKRYSGCHSKCPEYIKYHEFNERRNASKRLEAVLSDASPSQESRIKKNTLERMRRGR